MLRPNANVEIQKLVYWAAMSLDIGKKISPNRHHHHSAYLLKNCHLAGFSKTQQDWVANLVLGHRGKLEKIQTYLADEDWCSSLLALRIVALLNHEDNPIIFDKIELKTLKIGHWIIKIKEPNWLDLHPLTFFLL